MNEYAGTAICHLKSLKKRLPRAASTSVVLMFGAGATSSTTAAEEELATPMEVGGVGCFGSVIVEVSPSRSQDSRGKCWSGRYNNAGLLAG